MDNSAVSFEARAKCYRCYRPKSSCMCEHAYPVDTKTKFVILMHPKEFKKIKNRTGHLTHLSLTNSELYIGIDFSDHARVNALTDDPTNHCVLLYPLSNSKVLNEGSIAQTNKRTVIFILDATWDCSKKMLRVRYVKRKERKRGQFLHQELALKDTE